MSESAKEEREKGCEREREREGGERERERGEREREERERERERDRDRQTWVIDKYIQRPQARQTDSRIRRLTDLLDSTQCDLAPLCVTLQNLVANNLRVGVRFE